MIQIIVRRSDCGKLKEFYTRFIEKNRFTISVKHCCSSNS